MNSKEDSDSLSSPSGGREVCVSGHALWQWRATAQQEAIAADISADEVDWLLQDLAGLDRLSLRLETFKDKSEIRLAKPLTELDQLWQQRLHGRVPVQYLTGVAPWRQFLLKVSPSVLIPRPETECLIDLAIAATHPTSNSPFPAPSTQGHWVDLGTGSGAIAIGLAVAFPGARIHAVDYSAAALAIARANAQQLRLTDRIQFYEGSWLEPLAQLKGQLSGIVANPPYIPSDWVPSLQPEVAQHEPHLALDGGADGLDCIRQLVETAPDYLKPGGVWLVEMMAGQAHAVFDLLQQQGSYCQIQTYPDLAGIERFAIAFRK
ncbi:MAG: peptide chain release factor N(5)-glutamine methyltransferase [Leptolyngbya sp. BL-A-14]